jgi:amidohydrolase
MRSGGGSPHLEHGSWSVVEPWEDVIDARIAELQPRLIEMRRQIHAHPEPSGEERETTRLVAAVLSDAGFSPRILRDGLGAIADLDVGTPRSRTRRIAIRADLDALRMHDEKRDCPYRSTVEGVCHACGHDVHTATVLGAASSAVALAEALAAGLDSNEGARLRFIFQPAEETSFGARWVIEQGGLEGVDGILSLHCDPQRAAGTVGIRYGVLTAFCDEVAIRIAGHGGHAARPHHTIDPIACAGHVIGALYEFLPRAVDARSPSVFTIGKIEGGYTPNVIPERVDLHGTMRTTDAGSRERLRRRIREICAGAAHASQAKIDVEFSNPLGAVNNVPEFAAALEGASRHVLGRENVDRIDLPSMGGEDFAFYLDEVPGALLRLGCAVPGTDAAFLHSPLFDVDERIIAHGARILLRAALALSVGPPIDPQGAEQ